MDAARDVHGVQQGGTRPVNVENDAHEEGNEAHDAGEEAEVGPGVRSRGHDGYDDFGILVVLIGVEVAVHPYAVADDPNHLKQVVRGVDGAVADP